MSDKKPERLRRLVGYVPESKYLKLRSKLALKDKSITDWINEKVEEEIDED